MLTTRSIVGSPYDEYHSHGVEKNEECSMKEAHDESYKDNMG